MSEPIPEQSENAGGPQPSPQPTKRRHFRPWLLFAMLLALVALLIARPVWRADAAASTRAAARTVLFDWLGVSPRQLFVARLRVAGLYDSPLGERWRSAIDRAAPASIGQRLERQASFTADAIEAHVYDAALERGEQIEWRLSRDTPDGARLYASLEYRADGDDDWTTVTELVADNEPEHAVADRDGDYRIVLQPELFGVVKYTLAVATGGSLAMPVEGASTRDIGSGFGAPRDGGSRAHHGVDIFAARGTPLLAVVDGRVRTGTSGIGGNHIWLSGGVFGIGSARYYYAHLDSFNVESGDSVHKGDVIGYVGNTGNARTTPPHLHFGIYAMGGPVDPAAFLRPPPDLPSS